MTLDDRSHTISSSSESRNYADNTLRSVATAVNRFLASLPAARQSALGLEQELSTFLRSDLKLVLSEEKTKVTHLSDGFEFLGLRIQRCRSARGLKTKILIPRDAKEKLLLKLKHGTDASQHQDSVNS